MLASGRSLGFGVGWPGALCRGLSVMDTLRVRLGVTHGLTFLISGTIPQAYLLLMSLIIINHLSFTV